MDKMSDQQIAQMYELMQAIREKELQENDPEHVAGSVSKNKLDDK